MWATGGMAGLPPGMKDILHSPALTTALLILAVHLLGIAALVGMWLHYRRLDVEPGDGRLRGGDGGFGPPGPDGPESGPPLRAPDPLPGEIRVAAPAARQPREPVG